MTQTIPTVRTSISHPLHIATVPLECGAIGLTLCPGKQGASEFGAPWQRDLKADLDKIVHWGAAAVVTLVEVHELRSLGVPELGARIRDRGIQWHHLPIRDLEVPDEVFEAKWPAAVAQLRQTMAAGQRVLVHCRGGLGRAGTVAACLLVEHGVAPTQAIERIRRVRPHAIETPAQARYVMDYGPAVGRQELKC
ncbi:cyclin-dependent kinase inhibitor 3 family protein [Variovorax sp. dw_954]|uniref:cyclin-dependent kinase inhibitor 3 family protein n=1 Tax=Variovorax sp. dw_954 TaxID=2720078 RepID=UPI001C49E5A7|nr:cyclin-dependent kinase inhibitor 3 family protein [Variovorax sp. dw_954]